MKVYMNSKDLVSIIIPTYNRHKFLRQVLPGYLAQRDVCEVLIVDDGSTPPVEPELRDFLEANEHLRIIRHTRSLGSCMARNTGIREARGEFVFFGEDDLIVPEDHVRILLAERERLGADLICGRMLQQKDSESYEEAIRNDDGGDGEVYNSLHITVSTKSLRKAEELPFGNAVFLTRRCLLAKYQFSGHLGGPSFLREDNEIQLHLRRVGYRLFGTPQSVTMHLARHRTEGSGTRSARTGWAQAISAGLNSWQVIDEYYGEISPFFPGISKKEMIYRVIFTASLVGLKRRARAQSDFLNQLILKLRKY